MPYTTQQREANLAFFLNDFLGPTAEALRAVNFQHSLSRDYLYCSILEAFLWLHLGVRLEYFEKAQSRRTMYEFGNRVLAAYERLKNAQQLQKFSVPLQRIMDIEFSGRTELFGHVTELPEPLDDFTSAYQTALVLAGSFIGDADTQQLLKMVVFATPPVWESATGKRTSVGAIQESEVTDLSENWTFSGFFKVIQFMEASRQVRDDLKSKNAISPKPGYSVLADRLLEIQKWRLSFYEKAPQERFREIARSAIQVVRSEVTRGADEGKFTVDPEKLVASVNDLMMDWGAPPMKEGAKPTAR